MPDPRHIDWISPSAVSRLQACGLAESRRRAGGGHGKAASSPGARLGNAAHRVLEWVADSAPELAADSQGQQRIADRWGVEVAVEIAESAKHPAERHFGSASRWPSFGRIAATLKVDGMLLAAELSDLAPDRRRAELALASSDGTLRGTADLIVLDDAGNATIIDHKAGEVHDDQVEPDGLYSQQVLLYAAMARDAGITPASAEIRPLGGTPRTIEVTSSAMDDALIEARAQLHRYNQAVDQGGETELANPSEQACRWCPYIIDCSAAWSDEADLGDLALLEGKVQTVQVLTSSLAIRVLADGDEYQATGLPRTDISGATPVVGDRIRLARLRESAPRQLRSVAGQTTMLVL